MRSAEQTDSHSRIIFEGWRKKEKENGSIRPGTEGTTDGSVKP